MTLFTQEHIQAIEQLSLIARRVSAGGRFAEQRSADLGGGIEFRDFRSYVPGDDIRRVDWNLYRRSGELFLRLFDETEDLPVYILLDMSDSMFCETLPRADAARLIAGILAGVIMNQHDRVSVYPFGAELGRSLSEVSGKRNLLKVLNFLDDLRPIGATNFESSIYQFNQYKFRSGLVVIISDFFDSQGAETITRVLGQLNHRLLFVQITREVDREPVINGDFRLMDSETKATIDVTVSSAVLDKYRRIYQQHFDDLTAFAAGRRAAYLKIDADKPVLKQLNSLFTDGTLVV
jgi:uncharacterized protein (DUF58 family)